MKKLLVATLLILPLIAMEAKTIHNIVNPSYVGINDGTMKIVKGGYLNVIPLWMFGLNY